MHHIVKPRIATLEHLAPQIQALGARRVAHLVKKHEAHETDPWAAGALFKVELFTRAVLEPGVGTGNLARAAITAGYAMRTWDIFDWGYPGTSVRDFLAADRDDVWAGPNPWPAATSEFSVVCNPPFSRIAAFVAKALELGARKVAAFGPMTFYGSQMRRPWLDRNPPARIWLCGTRATCWKFNVPPARRRGRSTPTAHAWFVWERGHAGAPVTRCIWES